jgi:hypothetical protein
MACPARVILVVCTVFATFLAASLQGRVLCCANDGGHFAIEAPHPEAGCPAGHDEDEHHSDDGNAGGTDGGHPDEAPAGCTDVSAEFDVGRELTAAPADALHAPLPCVSITAPTAPAGLAHLSFDSLAARGHPPACSDLARLRTIILLG